MIRGNKLEAKVRTGRDTLLSDGKERMGRSGGTDRVDRDLKVSVGTVLESDRHRHTRSYRTNDLNQFELPMIRKQAKDTNQVLGELEIQ